ncbi:HEPN domain-containing protein [Amycolatopsis tucumanensis]|uniref:Apea-like HEPN domain-containing protein n=1 Tax=Amycolatopsis tucumanensis TaxID=401106 RepID=A0ABP7HEX9_9PSEU|nr:HEPN domain-containing protein [Amycolatopsis tucumanensis]MCF6427003.1 hypothetical protein [Amycolatopsis tucumanensis]
MSDHSDLRAACRVFVASAFAALAAEHVIPAPRYHAYMAVGRDYFGDSIMPLAEFTALEALLNKRYSERFADPLRREHAEFANTYIFGLLEACIIRCAQAGDFTPSGPTVEGVIDELLAVLGTSTRELVCARHVSHLTTASGNEIRIGDIAIIPQPEDSYRFLADRICREIPGAPRAWNRDLPHSYDPPHALLIIRGTTDTVNPYVARDRLSAKLERFLLLARLMTAGTVQSGYEVSGMTTLIACMDPQIYVSGKGLLDTLVRRTVRLTGDEAAVFAAVSNMIDTVDIKRDGIVATSFDVALGKYNQSHNTGSPYEHLVDLATALEGVLIGAENEGEGLTLRLCTRAAALLARDDDPAAAVFNDVKELYGLRSKLVHGGQIAEKDLRKVFTRVSTVPADDAEHRFGLALAYAVDRMRDLVRRAILARLCLAEQHNPIWPFTGRAAVDALLADDHQRETWRSHWHTRLASLGADYAGGKPRAAVDTISQEDR